VRERADTVLTKESVTELLFGNAFGWVVHIAVDLDDAPIPLMAD